MQAAVNTPTTKEIYVQAGPPGYAGKVCLATPIHGPDEQEPEQLYRHLLPVADVFCPDRDFFEESQAARACEIKKTVMKEKKKDEKTPTNLKYFF